MFSCQYLLHILTKDLHLSYICRQKDGGLPILDDPHHWAIYAYINDLGNLRQEVFLDLKTTLANAPAAIHEEGDVNFTVCSKRYTHIHVL